MSTATRSKPFFTYGDETGLWMRRWRRFFLATAGLFGYADGSERTVSHYRMIEPALRFRIVSESFARVQRSAVLARAGSSMSDARLRHDRALA